MFKRSLLTSLLFCCGLISSQTTIVDINPDSCACVMGLASETITLDLNTDGTNDFVFSVTSSNNSGGTGTASITALGSNSVAADAVGCFSLSAGVDVTAQSSWSGGQVKIEICTMIGWTGYWPPIQNDKYLAVKFYAGTSLYCGWIKLDVLVNQTNVQVKIKEYGYNTNCSLNCMTKVEEMTSENSLSIYPNPNNGTFKLKTQKHFENGEIILINVLGQKVHSQKLLQGENNVVTRNLSKGLYYCVLLEDKKQISTTKFVVD